MIKMPLCKCGCGIEGKGNYRRGHNNKILERKQRISIWAKERYKKQDVWNKGKQMSQQFRQKLSDYMKKNNPAIRPEVKIKISQAKKYGVRARKDSPCVLCGRDCG